MSTTEQEFLDEIDCRLPYGDLARCKQIIDRGIAISPNAAFGVLEEICRPPARARPTAEQLTQLLDYWRSSFRHPLGDMLAEVADAMILERDLSVDDVMKRIGVVAEYPGLYAALAILACSCDEADDRLEPVVAAIRQRWRAMPQN